MPSWVGGDSVIRRDRELFARIAQVSRVVGDLTLTLLHVTPDNVEFARALREVGNQFGSLSGDLLARAAELEQEQPNGAEPRPPLGPPP